MKINLSSLLQEKSDGKDRLPPIFALPPMMLIVVDGIFTLVGQPEGYWSGEVLPNESNPFASEWLIVHPALFLLGGLFYMVAVYLLMIKLRFVFAATLALNVYLWHIWGSSTWLFTLYVKAGLPVFDDLWWWLNVVYLSLVSIITVFIIRRQAESM